MGYIWYNPDEGVGIDGVLLKKTAPKSEDNNGSEVKRERDKERTERFNSFLERIESLIDKMNDAVDKTNTEAAGIDAANDKKADVAACK